MLNRFLSKKAKSDIDSLEEFKWSFSQKNASDLPSDYSVGATLTTTGSSVGSSGWPYPYAVILTLKLATVRGWQITANFNLTEFRVRSIDTASTWTAWRKIQTTAI